METNGSGWKKPTLSIIDFRRKGAPSLAVSVFGSLRMSAMGSTERKWLRSRRASARSCAPADRVKTDSLKVISMSGELSAGEDLLAANGRMLGDFEGERPRVNAYPEPASPHSSAKLTGSIVDHKTLREPRNLYTCSPMVAVR